MPRSPFIPTPAQAQALEAVGAAREREAVALQLARTKTLQKHRSQVGKEVRKALGLGIPKAHIKQALGSKNHDVISLYLGE